MMAHVFGGEVSIRAYQWCQMDGGTSDLPFLLFEIWGRPQAVVEAIDVLARRRKDEAETSGAPRGLSLVLRGFA